MSSIHSFISTSHKRTLRVFLRCSATFFLLAAFVAGLVPPLSVAVTPATPVVSIIFSHDMHSHFDPERFLADGRPAERGGFARMQTVIGNIKVDYPNTFLFDAGDFAMGTVYQTIYSSEAAELRLMGQMGYDALTFGNHEYDYRTQGATDMLNTALASKDPLPALTIANIDWEATFADDSLKENAQALQTALERYGNADYLIIEKGGIKLAVFGLIGISAGNYAPLSGLIFKDPIATAKAVVAEIKAETDADVIICLSHSGTYDNPKKSEDELLAKAVPDIDVIISGHTHTTLQEPLVIGNTSIVSCGAYSFSLGHLTLARSGDRYVVFSYDLIPIRENLAKDKEIEKSILEYQSMVDEHYLSLFDYEFDEVVASTPFAFTPIDEFGLEQGEDTLGNLISDSYIDAVKRAEGPAYREVDVAVAPRGVIRGSFSEGPITAADVYNVSSLGIGPDRIPGYPLVSIYLNGKELRTMAEVDISVSTLMIDARLYCSGLSYIYNPSRLLLNRVTDVYLMSPSGELAELEDDKLYRVVGGLYSCQMLGEVEAQSYGLLKVVPKDEEGNPIIDFEEHVIYSNGIELKEWVALADYLASFEPVKGIPQIPENYNQLQQRKIEDDSKSLVDLLKKPNKIFFIVLTVVVVLLAIIITATLLIVRKVRRSKKKREAETVLLSE